MWGSLFPLREAMPFEISRTLGSGLAQEPETETNPLGNQQDRNHEAAPAQGTPARLVCGTISAEARQICRIRSTRLKRGRRKDVYAVLSRRSNVADAFCILRMGR
jgi:hypothetical protein